MSQSETIFTAGLSGPPANKASIDLSNEPTQHSLLLDLYLLKSGEEKSGSFSTFPGICQIIDCLFSKHGVHLLERLGLGSGKGNEGTAIQTRVQVWTGAAREQTADFLQTLATCPGYNKFGLFVTVCTSPLNFRRLCSGAVDIGRKPA